MTAGHEILARLTAADANTLVHRRDGLENSFVKLLGNPEFADSISLRTGEIVQVRKCFDMVRILFQEVLR
jgi:hypothetical protein